MEPTAVPPEETLTPPAPPRPPFYRGLGPWLMGVALGALLILLGALYEGVTTADGPLDDALFFLLANDDAAFPEAVAAAAASGVAVPVTLHQLPSADDTLPEDGPFAPLADLMPRRWLVVLDDRAAEVLAPLVAPMLTNGALPDSGTRAVIAGPGAPGAGFALGGERYAVAGSLGKDAGIFYGKFVSFEPLPLEAAQDAVETREGYLFLEPGVLRDAVPEDEREHFSVTSGVYFAPGVTIALAILGLLVVAVSGSVAWIRLLWNLAGRGGYLFRPAFDACRAEAALLIQAHAILYGIFLGMMLLGLIFTDSYIAALAFVQNIFTTGELRDIGEAYESGNILAAKFQTWRHNYLFATVLLSALPSLIIPGAALIKNALSFAVIGFVMVPVLAGTAFVMSFHSITMWLELEAYILVSFAAMLIPVKVMRAIFEPSDHPMAERVVHAYARGAAVLGSMTLLAGIILLAAALYEATTLILLR